MSFLKELKKIEIKPIVKQTVKQKIQIVKQDIFKINPEIKTIDDIPNINIMTSGNLLGVYLRANRRNMLKRLRSYIDKLLLGEKNELNNKK